jgi:hypothetical protein
MKSWKIGAVSGLIAGIIAGLITVFFNMPLNLKLGLAYFPLPPLGTPFTKIMTVEIVINVIWGVFLGSIYSKIYDLIPGKRISKSLLFGLICYLITNIRGTALNLFYWYILSAISYMVFIFPWIAYALVLGFLYEFLQGRYLTTKEKLKIIRHDIRSGIHPGAIAGLLGGIIAFITMVIGIAIGFWPPRIPDPDIGFFLSQLGTHVFFNMIWGVVFGMLFVMFYDRIPSKDIKKGIVFSLTIFFITTFRGNFRQIAYSGMPKLLLYSYEWITMGFFMFLTVGFVLGLFYKK